MSQDKYPKPSVTVDIIVLAWDGERFLVPLVQRGSPPFEGSWALPGGFMDLGETLAEAALRELKEETGVEVTDLAQCQLRDEVHRDPRGRVLSVPYVTVVRAEEVSPEYGDDAAGGQLFPLTELPAQLAFDHRKILENACQVAKDRLEGGMFLGAELRLEERRSAVAAFPPDLLVGEYMMQQENDHAFLQWLKDWCERLPEVVVEAPEHAAVVVVDMVNGFCKTGNLASPRVGALIGP
ncbi:MAG: NUDIX hydrolase, partial [Chloroflexota bacterium]|nr:NUDIX hydrolase [Chloroflexota bacterium]